MRDEQVRRYARHILLPDVGGLGQTALMVSSAQLELRESEPAAELIAATFLAAGGVGAIAMPGATAAQLATLQTHGPDTRITDTVPEPGIATNTAIGTGRRVELAPRPAWWPTAPGDDRALAFWRGSMAAVRWMADVANK